MLLLSFDTINITSEPDSDCIMSIYCTVYVMQEMKLLLQSLNTY